MERIGIAGTGRMAQALGRLLYERGQPIAAIAGRDPTRTRAAAAFIHRDVLPVSYSELPAQISPNCASRILIAVPDDALEEVARTLAGAPQTIDIALHTCGSRGPDALAPLQTRGASCATLHPLQTVTTPEQGVAALPGSSFGVIGSGITGSGPAAEWALEICALLDGHALTVAPGCLPLYHAAAVMASNYIVTMIDASVQLMGLAGIPEERALQALAPLIQASIANSLAMGPAQALTGPIERGDARTVAAHLAALDKVPETVRQLYRHAGLHTIEVVRRKDVARRKAPGVDRRKIESLLKS